MIVSYPQRTENIIGNYLLPGKHNNFYHLLVPEGTTEQKINE